MKQCISITVIVLAFFSVPHIVGAQSALDDARKLVESQQYDAAIVILDQHLRGNPSSADGHLLLAQAHHWKKDVGKAKASYQKAAKLNPKYTFEIIPLLDELEDWNEVIRIASPAITKERQLSPSLLGSLASAYQNTGKSLDAERIMNILATTDYKNQNSEDYKNYVLAYFHLWDDDKEKSKERLKRIKNKAYLKYARTHNKFKKLQSDAEFLELTK